MARVDDYKKTFEIAAEKLADRDMEQIALLSGAELAEGALLLNYYGRPISVMAYTMEVAARDNGPEIPIAEKALILQYLVGADGKKPTGEWVTYREVPAGEFYYTAFVKRAIKPLMDFFGQRPDYLYELSPMVGGAKAEGMSADAAVVVTAFPHVPILYQIWAGDDEFPAEGNVLFDKTIVNTMETESIALAAGLPIYKMMAMSYQKK